MTKIIGKHATIKRIQTGYYSLDRACVNDRGDLGIPIGTGYEIFGLTGTGKSTFCYSLAGLLGKKLSGDVALADFEGYNDNFLLNILSAQGFEGDIHSAYEKIDEEQLDKFIDLMDKKCVIGLIDSIGAIASMGENKGDLGERHMGERGFVMAQFWRKLIKLCRFNDEKTILATNHWYPRLGQHGYITPGGEVKKYLTTVRIKLQRDPKNETFPDGSYTLIGTVVKNRWGYQDRTFNLFILSGLGLHLGLSTLWDCIQMKLVHMVQSGKNQYALSIEKEDIGKLGRFVRLAKEGNTEIFEPFYKLLEEQKNEGTENIDNEGTETITPESEEGNSLDD